VTVVVRSPRGSRPGGLVHNLCAVRPGDLPRGHSWRMDEAWYDGIARGIRNQRRRDDEGGTWVLFLDEERRPINAIALPPAVELGPLELDGLATVIDGVDAPAVIVAVPRSDGEPLADDWRLWEEMRARLAVGRSELVDLIVVGGRSWWAVVGRQPESAT
jgi:hypothetical protein